MKLKDLVDELKSVWTALSGLAAVIITFLAYFVAEPPMLWRESGQQPDLLKFLVIAVVAAVLSRVIAGQKPAPWVTFKLLTPLAIIITVVHFILSAQFSCPFAGERMSIGWTYLPDAADYVAKNPDQSCRLLIADFIGDTDKIWPRGQILTMWLIVWAVYIFAVTSLTATAVRVMQHLRGE